MKEYNIYFILKTNKYELYNNLYIIFISFFLLLERFIHKFYYKIANFDGLYKEKL